MRYKRVKLNDGGILCYARNNISKTTLIDINFDCGSRCDTIPGLAHFCEHMFFTGTKDLTKEEVSKKYFDFMNVNAYTSFNKIQFSGNVFTDELEDYVDTVRMMITDSTFTNFAVEKELGVIKQEIVRSKDKYDRFSGMFNDLCLTEDERYNYTALGTSETISTIKSADIKKFVNKYFVRENLYIDCVSPLPLSRVKKIISSKLSTRLKSKKDFTKLPLYSVYSKKKTFYKIKNDKIDKNYINLNLVFDKTKDDWEFKRKFRLVRGMINDFSDGLMKKIRLEKSLVYGGGFHTSFDDKNCTFTFSSECETKNINELIRSISEYFNEMLKSGFTEAQLKKEKREFDYSKKQEEPRTYKLMAELSDFKYYDKVIDNKKYIKKIKQTNLEECNETLKEILKSSVYSLSIYGNATKKELLSEKEFNILFKF